MNVNDDEHKDLDHKINMKFCEDGLTPPITNPKTIPKDKYR